MSSVFGFSVEKYVYLFVYLIIIIAVYKPNDIKYDQKFIMLLLILRHLRYNKIALKLKIILNNINSSGLYK